MEYVIGDETQIDYSIQLARKVDLDFEIDLPIATIEKKPDIYRGKMLGDGATMVNGKAPYGSSIYDQVWTVVYHYLNSAGEITGESRYVNVRWSDI